MLGDYDFYFFYKLLSVDFYIVKSTDDLLRYCFLNLAENMCYYYFYEV